MVRTVNELVKDSHALTIGTMIRTRTQAALKTLSALAAVILLCPSAFAAGTTHHYTVAVDAALTRLTIEAQFSHPVSGIRARSRKAEQFLIGAKNCTDGNEDSTIRVRNRRMILPEAGISCLRYSVDLRQAAKEYRGARNLDQQNVVASPSYWLWRPSLRDSTELQISFTLPAGMQVSVPWQQDAGNATQFTLSESPQSAHAPAVFGNFDYREIEVPGATLRLTQLKGDSAMDNDAIANWIRATATDVSLTYGRFPNPSPQIVVMPVQSSRSAVAFGRVVRDGGETVELLVDPDGDVAEFYSDWTATHEFSHMMLPYLDSDYHWISEGFSQYYQNILLTRAGAYDAQMMWQKLYDGFERGRQSQPSLSPNQAADGGGRGSRMKVYWSGAALALMADVTLRERSGGEETLDDVLERLQSCCLPSRRTWSGAEFYAQLDTLVDTPIFMALYDRYADTAGFPDTSDIYARLGLEVSDGKVSSRPDAELLDIREAMTKTDSAAARLREQLAAD